MSKKAFVLVLTALFVLTAASAFAAWGNTSYSDAQAGVNPHGNYDTTSNKCAVCHAVHGAEVGGQRLLRAGGSCTYCHIQTDAGNVVVYNGVTTVWSTDNEYAHNANCEICHTVHGVGAANITGTAGGTQNLIGLNAFTAISAANDFSSVDGTRSAVSYAGYSVSTKSGGTLTQWCSGCHPYFNTGLNGPTHVMRAATATYPTSAGAATVAYNTSATCVSCHDATAAGTAALAGGRVAPYAGVAGQAFPHYTNGARFLLSSQTSVTVGTKTAVSAGDTDLDGVCLKCHVSNATTGVGRSF